MLVHMENSNKIKEYPYIRLRRKENLTAIITVFGKAYCTLGAKLFGTLPKPNQKFYASYYGTIKIYQSIQNVFIKLIGSEM